MEPNLPKSSKVQCEGCADLVKNIKTLKGEPHICPKCGKEWLTGSKMIAEIKKDPELSKLIGYESPYNPKGN